MNEPSFLLQMNGPDGGLGKADVSSVQQRSNFSLSKSSVYIYVVYKYNHTALLMAIM